MSRWGRMALGGAALAAGAVAWWQVGPSIEELARWLTWMRDSGPAGLAAFVVFYAVATWLMAPASWLQGTAGFLLGPVGGFLAASLLSTSFGTGSFLLAKTALRGPLLKRFEGPRLRAIDLAVGEGGLGLVALLRLSPISPYNVVNYLLGLTGVRLRDYVLGTWLGSMVPVALYTYVGSTVGELSMLLAGEADAPSWVQWVGLALTVVVTMGVTRFAKTTLNDALARAEGRPVGPSGTLGARSDRGGLRRPTGEES